MMGGGAGSVGWFENALAWAGRVPLEVTVKNTVGQITKEFYGFGPRAAACSLIEGRLALYLTPLSGSAVLRELASRPAGRIVIDYNNRLLLERCQEPLARLAAAVLKTRLEGLFVDFDEGSGQVVGAALFGDPVSGITPAGEAGGEADFLSVVGAWTDPARWTFHPGRGALWGTGPSLLAERGWPPGTGREWTELEKGRAWREIREGVAGMLRARWRRAAGRDPVVFVGDDGRVSVAGVVVDIPVPGG